MPTSSPVALRSSPRLTVTPSGRTWWAAVSTRFRPITVPDPNRQPRPIPTTAAPCLVASSAMPDSISLITPKDIVLLVTCNLLVTLHRTAYHPAHARRGETEPSAPPEPPSGRGAEGEPTEVPSPALAEALAASAIAGRF